MDKNIILSPITIDELKKIVAESVTIALAKLGQSDKQDELLRRCDVAKELKVSVKTVAAWMKSGRLPYHRINTRIFIKRSELIDAMAVSGKGKKGG